jgi:hypothetical protein
MLLIGAISSDDCGWCDAGYNWLMGLSANFGVSDRRFRFKPAGGFGGNRQAVSVQSATPLRMGFGPDFGEPPLRDTSYLALVCQASTVLIIIASSDCCDRL